MTRARRWVATGFGGPEVLEQIAVELPEPRAGEVTIDVNAAGMNPADYKHFGPGQDPNLLPLTIGSEVAGVISAIGPDTEIASGAGSAGDEVVAFQISDGYSSALNASAKDVFAKPPPLTFPEAANLLLVGTTAADTLDVIGLSDGETLLVHAAAGGVGTSVVQQARLLGATVIGTAAAHDFEAVRGFGATPVQYGPGLEERVREAAPDGIDAVVDTVGVDRPSTCRWRSSATASGSSRPQRSAARRRPAFRRWAPATRGAVHSAPPPGLGSWPWPPKGS